MVLSESICRMALLGNPVEVDFSLIKSGMESCLYSAKAKTEKITNVRTSNQQRTFFNDVTPIFKVFDHDKLSLIHISQTAARWQTLSVPLFSPLTRKLLQRKGTKGVLTEHKSEILSSSLAVLQVNRSRTL